MEDPSILKRRPPFARHHIQVLAKLMLTSSLCMSYAYIMDAFEPFYSRKAVERTQFLHRLFGDYAGIYWGMIFCNCLLPLMLCFRRMRASHAVLCVVSAASRTAGTRPD